MFDLEYCTVLWSSQGKAISAQGGAREWGETRCRIFVWSCRKWGTFGDVGATAAVSRRGDGRGRVNVNVNAGLLRAVVVGGGCCGWGHTNLDTLPTWIGEPRGLVSHVDWGGPLALPLRFWQFHSCFPDQSSWTWNLMELYTCVLFTV